jgi:hypothetical protein
LKRKYWIERVEMLGSEPPQTRVYGSRCGLNMTMWDYVKFMSLLWEWYGKRPFRPVFGVRYGHVTLATSSALKLLTGLFCKIVPPHSALSYKSSLLLWAAFPPSFPALSLSRQDVVGRQVQAEDPREDNSARRNCQ